MKEFKDGDLESVAEHALECVRSHDPEARVIGNCRAKDLAKIFKDYNSDREFYRKRVDALQKAQSKMRDPERTMVCDILGNGFLYDPKGDRYKIHPF